MTIADEAKTILLLESFAAEAKRLADERRSQLRERACKQLEEDGVAPSWTLPEVAEVGLSVTHTAAYIADMARFTAWVAAKYPQEMESTVRPAFVATFLKTVAVEGDSVVDCTTGEIVPGAGVRRGGLPDKLSIRAKPGVKGELAVLVGQMLATAHPEIAGPPGDAPAAPDDPWIPSGDPFAAFPARGGT